MTELMDLQTALPPQLVQSLTNPTTPIKDTAEAFLSLKTVVGKEFPRACQLKNTLEQVGGQQQQQQLQLAAITKGQGHGVIGSGKRTDGNVSGAESGLMEYKVEYSDGQYTLKINEDELCALLLNAEFVLVKMYTEYGIRRNPFLIRWIELYQRLLDDFVDSDYGDEDGNHRYGEVKNGKSDGEVRLVKVRAAFIGAVLNEIDQISDYSPKEYALDSTHYPVDISIFDDALIEQCVYESKDEIPWNQDRDSSLINIPQLAAQKNAVSRNGIWGPEPQNLPKEMPPPSKQSITQKDIWQTSHTPTPPPGLPPRTSYFPPQPPPGQQQNQQNQHRLSISQSQANYNALALQQEEQRNESVLINKLITTLLQAQVDELPDTASSRLIKHFTDYPHHLLAVLDPSEPNLSALVQVNPKLTRALVQIYLLSTSRDSAERKELLHTMQRLPVNLGVLELINHLVILATATAQGGSVGAGGINGNQPILTKQEIDILLHGYLSNAMLKTETIGSSTPSGNATPGLNGTLGEAGYFSGVNSSLNGMATPGSRGGLTPVHGGFTGGLQARSMQVRMVQLLCLFVGALMKAGIMRVEEYFYEVQELGVRYIFVKEARELWQRVNTGKV